MTTEKLSCVEVNPNTPPTASVIWLHGLGADGHDFANMVPELRLPKDLSIRFVFPHAPVRPITINGGMAMRAWYDISGVDFNAREDETGVRASQQAIDKLIAHENKQYNIPTHKIILGGFSQGGAVALHAGLRYPETLGGIIALSTYLPLANLFLKEISTANKTIPVFMAHGLYDPVVPIQWGQGAAEFLKKSGYPLEFHTYPMQHNVTAEEITDISNWLIKTIKT